MNKCFNKIIKDFIPFFVIYLLLSLLIYGCHYCSPEGDEMRPINELKSEMTELEKKIKMAETENKKEKSILKQKKDSIKFINREIDTLKILIN